MEKQKLSLEFKIAKDILNKLGIDPRFEWNLDLVFDTKVQKEIQHRVSSLHPAKLGVIVAGGIIPTHEAVRRSLHDCRMTDGRECMEIWGKAVIRGATMKLLMDNNDRIRASRAVG